MSARDALCETARRYAFGSASEAELWRAALNAVHLEMLERLKKAPSAPRKGTGTEGR